MTMIQVQVIAENVCIKYANASKFNLTYHLNKILFDLKKDSDRFLLRTYEFHKKKTIDHLKDDKNHIKFNKEQFMKLIKIIN